MGELKAMFRVVNVPLPLFNIGLDKVLVNCQAVDVKPEENAIRFNLIR